MAKLTVINKAVPQPPIPQPDRIESTFTLELTAAEVVVIKSLTGKLGGAYNNAAHAACHSIYNALPETDIPYQQDYINAPALTIVAAGLPGFDKAVAKLQSRAV